MLSHTLEWKDGKQEAGPPQNFLESWENVAVPFLAKPELDHLAFFDGGASVLTISRGPKPGTVVVSAHLEDRWSLFGLKGARHVDLSFGAVPQVDAQRLVRFFFNDDYPTLRALEKGMVT